MLRRTCAAALLASAMIASPAMARDKTLYLGIEAGPMWAKNIHFDLVDDPLFDTGRVEDFLVVDHKLGYDVAAIFGYDAGIVRAELEAGYKRAGHDEYDIRLPDLELDEWSAPVTTDGDGSTRVISTMFNLLLDVGNEDGLSFYAGPGAGFSWTKVKVNGSTIAKRGGVALQGIAGIRYALNANVDLGLKYRYFRGNRISESFEDEVDTDLRGGRFKSHSLLATLTYNFYTPPPPPPPPAPPPPPPPPPATQTCPDGSVILATEMCPAPPPPPPPPPPAPERG